MSNNNSIQHYQPYTVITFLIFIVLSIAFLLFIANRSGQETEVQTTKDNCISDECLGVDGLEYPIETKKPQTDIKSLLSKAIDDEYKARATYDAVVSKLGSVRPFVMIRSAEESHIASLKALFDKYGIPIPEDPYTNITPLPILAENCKVGVEAEIANVNLYKTELIPYVTDYPDISVVFNNLMSASRDKHLPAFEKCS